ncbi:MAG: hypothetical protein ACK6DC_11460, partial [Planctomycetota bacterium]
RSNSAVVGDGRLGRGGYRMVVSAIAWSILDQRLLDGIREILHSIERPSYPISLLEGLRIETVSEVSR